MITKIAMMRKKIRKPIVMRMFPLSAGEFSSEGRVGKVLTDPKIFSSPSSAIEEDWFKEKESRLVCFRKEFLEDKAGFSVELADEYSLKVFVI